MPMRKTNKTLSLPLDVVEQLETEANQSLLVEQLLRAHYRREADDDLSSTPEGYTIRKTLDREFVEQHIAPSDSGWVEKSKLRQAYQQFASERELLQLTPEEFGRAVMALGAYDVHTTQPRADDGRRLRGYKGIKLTESGEELLR